MIDLLLWIGFILTWVLSGSLYMYQYYLGYYIKWGVKDVLNKEDKFAAFISGVLLGPFAHFMTYLL